MGQMAEDILEGACCSLCMSYFEEEQGAPVVCEECYKELNSEEKKLYTVTKAKTL